ncbi:hypothetical protein C8R43DRAFT_1131602 [Mycena crocata]|nr:hypothetical protein C8R43DRAFT_1131602 [Mycena crocata]
MPTTFSTTSLIAGGGDDLDDDSCLRLIPRPTTLSSSSPMFRSKSPASRGSLPSDIVLAVSSSTDALGALSAESADFGLVGPSLARHDTPTTRSPALAEHFGSSGAQGFLVLVWHLRSSFPTVELGPPRFPRPRSHSATYGCGSVLATTRLRSVHATSHLGSNGGRALMDSFRAITCFSQHPATPNTIPAPTDPVRRSLGSTAHKPSKTRLHSSWELFSVRSSHDESSPSSYFGCIVGLTSSLSRSCTQLTSKRSGGLWLLNSNLRSKLLVFENLDYELGDRPQEPLIIFKFWTPFGCSKPTLHFHRRDDLQFWERTSHSPDLLRRSKAGTIALKVLLHDYIQYLIEGGHYNERRISGFT